jgi:hypothetical protein
MCRSLWNVQCIIFVGLGAFVGCSPPTPPPSVEVKPAVVPHPVDDKKPVAKPYTLTKAEVEGLLRRFEKDEIGNEPFVRAGAQVVPILLEIIHDAGSTSHAVAGAFGAALAIKDHQKDFMPAAIELLRHGDPYKRLQAFMFLSEQTVDSFICPILVTGLYRYDVASYLGGAGYGLVRHGGEVELAALEIWREQHTDRADLKDQFAFVTKCADQLREKLRKKHTKP